MALLSLSPHIVLELVSLGFFIALYLIHRSHRLLPPGPNPIPVIGRVHFPVTRLDLFKKWGESYEDVMTLRIWGRSVIVLNSQRAAFELLEKRAAITSIRPKLIMAHELVGYKDSTSQTNDLALHKMYRRLFATALSARTSQRYWPMEERELRKATLYMLAVPGCSTAALKRAMSAISFFVAYGYNIESDGDAFIDKIVAYMRVYQRILRPGEFLVDIIPILRHLPTWFPGAGFKHQAVHWKQNKEDIHDVPFQRVKRDMATGKALPSFTSTLLEELAIDPMAASKYSEEHVKRAAGSIYTGGNDNNTSSIQSLLVAMLLFPAVQEKAQTELDRVIGRERPPSVADRDILPYCAAIVQEILRWQPATPFALPHALDQDEEFRGYVLPKGTTIMANVWAMTRDESVYPRPEEFIPERHLIVDEKGLRLRETARHLVTFGFGRRVCPGSALAESVVFAGVVSILWACTISRPSGTENFEIEYETFGVRWPKEFPIKFEPRFPGAMDILRSAVYDAEQ
ncbi:cytochrome P450 [Calocera viscosa TUFC12733]|uniref:Cytochrome P450 n=1 Tax=Calocera viscosa (strain TUFC12733) TaxID=1330018 RepID=A0A167QEX2_CALVF|nr:cytochrome P450 [Calocera viscosa TUFC12733]